MITDLILELFTSILAGFLSLAPQVSFNAESIASIAGAINGLGAANGYFPVNTLAICLAAVMGLKVIMLGYRLLLFIYHQFWGSS